jgi:phenylpyruvate tautomerase PptA (4-oxalocrotonate tautomerase family)
MPFIRTSIRKTRTLEDRKKIVAAIHDALVTSIDMPHDELFNIVETYDDDSFFYDRSFNGIRRTDDLVVVEITLRRGRGDRLKRAMYKAIADNIAKAAGQSERDVFIFLHENEFSDWSVGNGFFAMELAQQRGSDS